MAGELHSTNGAVYPIVAGVPRFVQESAQLDDVDSFGVEWNYFNFDDFRVNWLEDTVANTFGSSEACEF